MGTHESFYTLWLHNSYFAYKTLEENEMKNIFKRYCSLFTHKMEKV